MRAHTGVEAAASRIRTAVIALAAWALMGPSPAGGQARAPVPGIELHDANPALSAGGPIGRRDALQLAALDLPRQGAATDGVSRLLVKVVSTVPGDARVVLTDPGRGTVAQPFGTRMVQVGDRYMAFAFYDPPETTRAPPGDPDLWLDEVAFDAQGIEAHFTAEEGGSSTARSAIVLARPPVVLVHGTFDSPGLWSTASERGPAFEDAMAAAGYRTFAVDFSRTAGFGPDRTGFFSEGTSFEANRRVVLENPGGIRDALTHYRDQLDLAATQADVVGHSLGGLLPRVLASSGYNPDYAAAENFGAGWINRLVTLASPHHGSDLPTLLGFLADLDAGDLTDLESGAAWAARTGLWLAGVQAGSGVVHDQLPRSDALRRIGSTGVPSHAVVARLDHNRIADARAGDRERYIGLYGFLADALVSMPGVLDAYLTSIIRERLALPPELRPRTSRDGTPAPDEIRRSWEDAAQFREIVFRAFEDGVDDWLARRDRRWLETVDHFVEQPRIPAGLLDPGFGDDDELELLATVLEMGGASPVANVLRPSRMADSPPVPHATIDLVRQLVFRNDWNDGTVRVQSQDGGLPDAYTTRIEEPTIHSLVPMYPSVQRSVVDVLNGGMDRFAPGGFPEAGQQLPVYLPEQRFAPAAVEGDAAICWSGMVYEHALAYAAVADSADAIVMVRPVNHDATEVIARNAATKGMPVKGKSSNWGPQRGYIPADQRFSKLWVVFQDPARQQQIDKFQAKVDELLSSGPRDPDGMIIRLPNRPAPATTTRPLQVDAGGEVYRVMVVPDERDAAEAIRLVRPSGDQRWESCDWRTSADDFSRDARPTDCTPVETLDGLDPMRVLADATQNDPTGNPAYLTADYDLLTIGPRRSPRDPTTFAARGADIPYLPHDFLHDAVRVPGRDDPVDGLLLRYPGGDLDTVPFHPTQGFITYEQELLVDRINHAVSLTGYTAGNVTHHGPENQYTGSPYIDYPVTVFEPAGGDGVGRILAIPMGPPGFRDLHLKRYFARKRLEGYDLLPNPEAVGWQWDAWDPYDRVLGWDPRDAVDLPPYVAELERPSECTPVRMQSPPAALAEEEDEEPEVPEPALEARIAGSDGPAVDAEEEIVVLPENVATVFDSLHIYFTPPIDTTGGFGWRIERPDGESVMEGTADPESAPMRAPPGSPGDFVIERRWPTYRGGGNLRLTVCDQATSGVFGQPDGGWGCEEWAEAGTFSLVEPVLKLRGVVHEVGTLDVVQALSTPTLKSGWSLAASDLVDSTVVVRAKAEEWFSEDTEVTATRGLFEVGAVLADARELAIGMMEGYGEPYEAVVVVDTLEARNREGRTEERIRGVVHRTYHRTTDAEIRVELPRRLPLAARSFGPVSVEVGGENRAGLRAAVSPLVPSVRIPPTRDLHEADDRLGDFDVDHASSDELLFFGSGEFGVLGSGRTSAPYEWFPGNIEVGLEPRPVREWLTEPGAVWVMPIRVHYAQRIGAGARPPDLYAFALYGLDEAVYEGGAPQAPGARVDVVAGRTEDPGEAGDPDVATEGADPEGEPTGPPPGEGDVTALDPAVPPPSREGDPAVTDAASPAVATLPDYRGRPVGSVRAELLGAGVEVAVRITADAAGASEAHTVVRQSPEPGVPVAADDTVQLDITGDFVPVVALPDVTGRTVSRAADELRAAGLEVDVERIGPAPSADLADRVTGQSPPAGAGSAPGTPVTLTAYGAFDARAEARERCTRLIGEGMRAQGAGNFTRALDLYRQARSLDCEHPRLADAERDARTGQAEAAAERERQAAEAAAREEAARQRAEAERQRAEEQRRAEEGRNRQRREEEARRREELARRCTGLVQQAARADDAGDYEQAEELAIQASELGCRGSELERVYEHASQCQLAIILLNQARRNGQSTSIAQTTMRIHSCVDPNPEEESNEPPPRDPRPDPPSPRPPPPEPDPVIDFRQGDPNRLVEVCPASVTLDNGTVLRFLRGEGKTKGIELGYACLYGAEPGQGASTAIGWDYIPVRPQSNYTFCRDGIEQNGWMYGTTHDVVAHADRRIQGWRALLRRMVAHAQSVQVGYPCSNR